MSTSEVLYFAEVILRAPAELIRHAEILAVWQHCRLNEVIVEALERYMADPEVIVEALERYMADPPVQMQMQQGNLDPPETSSP